MHNNNINAKLSSQLFEFPNSTFTAHLNVSGNERIFFSGKFGIGKTAFLRQFLKSNAELYRPFFLCPVNYSIASNEDIYTHVRYDIITEMLAQDLKPQTVDLAFLEKLPAYLKQNLLKVSKTIVSMIPNIGKNVIETYDKLVGLAKDFESFHDPNQQDEQQIFLDFMTETEAAKNSWFATEVVTSVIFNVLSRLKDQSKRENILIIDDLDRIDPDHIFRLLNIFAAHLSYTNELKNKLGFDKIILVGDVKNVRNIFRAKFGVSTDFNGYIDKFYSVEVFHFDNREILFKVAQASFECLRVVSGKKDVTNEYAARLFENFNSVPMMLLVKFIEKGFLGLRPLVTRHQFPTALADSETLSFGRIARISKLRHPFLVHFRVLKDIVGSYHEIRELSTDLMVKEFQSCIGNVQEFCSIAVYFLAHDQHCDESSNTHHVLKVSDLEITYQLGNPALGKYRITIISCRVASQSRGVDIMLAKTLFDELMHLFANCNN